jgi:hypothetical protein
VGEGVAAVVSQHLSQMARAMESYC